MSGNLDDDRIAGLETRVQHLEETVDLIMKATFGLVRKDN